MSKKIRIFIPILFLLLVGCSFSPNELKLAEHAMETSPDSALRILKQMKNYNTMSDADKALYGLLYFQALDKNESTLQPDSIISFSVKFFQKNDEGNRLATCYYYKAKVYKSAQRYDEATVFYLKSLNLCQRNNDYLLLGNIYADLGYICSIQRDYSDSRFKYEKAIEYYRLANKPLEVCYKLIDYGRTYRLTNRYSQANKYFNEAISQTKDPYIIGLAYQEIGINYYWAKKYELSLCFLKKSLKYPYRNYNFAVRCYTLSDLYFDLAQYDSASFYAKESFKYQSSYFTKRECYRILANVYYMKSDFKSMAFYMTKYQQSSDSVRVIEAQTKSTILENLYETSETVSKSKYYILILSIVIPCILILALYIYWLLRRKTKGKEILLEKTEEQLIDKQDQLIESLMNRVKSQRELLSSTQYRQATLIQKEQMERDMYVKVLNLDNWHLFEELIDKVFNQLFVYLDSINPDITKKEKIWCSLYLLNTPTPSILIVLEIQVTSLYKLKQRLTQKLNLKSTKDLEQLLHDRSRIKHF